MYVRNTRNVKGAIAAAFSTENTGGHVGGRHRRRVDGAGREAAWTAVHAAERDGAIVESGGGVRAVVAELKDACGLLVQRALCESANAIRRSQHNTRCEKMRNIRKDFVGMCDSFGEHGKGGDRAYEFLSSQRSQCTPCLLHSERGRSTKLDY